MRRSWRVAMGMLSVSTATLGVSAITAGPAAAACGNCFRLQPVPGQHVAEGNTAEFHVQRVGDTTGTVSVRYRTVAGTATGGSDFRQFDDLITFGPGEAEALLSVNTFTDFTVEPSETFAVQLYDATGAAIDGPDSSQVTIDDTSSAPKVYVIEASTSEGNAGSHAVAFTIVLNKPWNTTITVDYATKSGTARSASGDYIGVKGTVTFPPGYQSVDVFVNVLGDTRVEPDERFVMLITNPTGGAVLGHGGATGWIRNDD